MHSPEVMDVVCTEHSPEVVLLKFESRSCVRLDCWRERPEGVAAVLWPEMRGTATIGVLQEYLALQEGGASMPTSRSIHFTLSPVLVDCSGFVHTEALPERTIPTWSATSPCFHTQLPSLNSSQIANRHI